jgi:polyphenol oxidase
MSIEALTHPLLTGVSHGFLGRSGGVSTGELSGLNVSYSEDDPALTAENRRRAVEAVLPGGTVQVCYQIHSPDVVTVTDPWADADRPKADALVTNRTGLVLGVLTADCAPVLFCDAAAGVIGAAHAGWKGAFTGVTDSTIAAMEALGATRANIAAIVGPCIAQKSYEVDAAFETRFLEQAPENERFFRTGREGHAWFDLEGYVASRLLDAGLTHVGIMGEDTYAQEDRFYSFRRATHRAEAGYGRQISLIGLPA